MALAAELQAAVITGRLWAAISVAGGPRPASWRPWHFPGAYDPAWLAALPLPTGENRPAGQLVALLDDQDVFERHRDPRALSEAYSCRRPTRVYENIDRDAPRAWYSIAAGHLGRLAGSELQVVCSVFESAHGDASLGGHADTWYAAIVQMVGAKRWQAGNGAMLAGQPRAEHDLVTRAGDILLMPKGLHAVGTPAVSGRSVHLVFAIDQDRPGTVAANVAGRALAGDRTPGGTYTDGRRRSA